MAWRIMALILVAAAGCGVAPQAGAPTEEAASTAAPAAEQAASPGGAVAEHSCLVIGSFCLADVDCCSGPCGFVSPGVRVCLPSGLTAGPGDHETAAPAVCLADLSICTRGDQCCSQQCINFGNGKLLCGHLGAARDAEPAASGPKCVPPGSICHFNFECCDDLCVPVDANGLSICVVR